MSIEDPTVVDFVGTDRDSGHTVLTITDPLDWEDHERHVSALEAKLAAYVRFVEGGQLLEQRREAEGTVVEVRLVCRHDPTDEALRFLDDVRAALGNRGLGFSWKIVR